MTIAVDLGRKATKQTNKQTNFYTWIVSVSKPIMFLSDSSVDTPYKDSTGIDLEDFIRKTLNKTPKDRSMLIKLEGDLVKFIREPK